MSWKIIYIIPLLFLLLSSLVIYYYFSNQKQEVEGLQRKKEEVQALYEGQMYEEVVEKMKSFQEPDEEVLYYHFESLLALGQMNQVINLAKQNQFFDARPQIILDVVKVYEEKGQINQAMVFLLNQEDLVKTIKDDQEIEQIKAGLLEHRQQSALPVSHVYAWYHDQAILVSDQGLRLVSGDGRRQNHFYDSIYITEDGFIAEKNQHYYQLDSAGKYLALVREDEMKKGEDVEKQKDVEEGEKVEKQKDTGKGGFKQIHGGTYPIWIESDFSQKQRTEPLLPVEVKRTDQSYAYYYNDLAITEPSYEEASPLSPDGICYVKEDDIWYQLKFLALHPY